MQNVPLILASMGYPVLPCAPNSKIPRTTHGLLDATTDETTIEGWISAWPDSNWAVRTDGLLVIDVAGLRSTAGAIARGVDTRSNGGYVLVPPSSTPAGRYIWAIELGPREGLPEAPESLVALLQAEQRRIVLPTGPEQEGVIPEGRRNVTLTSLGGALRRIGLCEVEIVAALSEINRQRCRPALDAEEVQRIATSLVRYEPDQLATVMAEGMQPPAIGSVPDPGLLPEELCYPGGLLGQYVEYCVRGAYVPQPRLALAGGLAMLGSVFGRRVQDTYGTRTNVYVVGVAATGAGKERARAVSKDLLAACGLGELLGPESIASSA
ncbi:MAG: hypothetical protein EBR82_47385, partial [Caulobacteraceae bacterium]|nr:hypothetical protein [Caulobacteraceae bacterium]